MKYFENITNILYILNIFNIFILQFVSTFYTGYYNHDNDTNLLRCSYMLSGLVHMHYTQFELQQSVNNNDFFDIVNIVTSYKSSVLRQITSLYYQNNSLVGALWVLHFYFKVMLLYYSNEQTNYSFKWNNANEILKTHNYVINILKWDVLALNCPNGSEYDLSNFKFDHYITLNSQERKLFRENNIHHMIVLIENNINLNKFPFNFKKFELHWLPLKVNSNILSGLMNEYNIQVKWNNEEQFFRNCLENYNNVAFLEKWSYNNLQSYKLYYTNIFHLLNVIMLRLTWKHFLYLNHQKLSNIVKFTQRWLEIMQDYSTFLYIENVSAIEPIMKSIEDAVDHFTNKTNQCAPSVLSMIGSNSTSNIKTKLKSLCNEINFTVSDEYELNGLESSLLVRSSASSNKSKQHNPTKSKIIKLHSLDNTYDFLNHVKKMFKGVDFRVVYSIISYIVKL
ncbi:uncharacterized protein LOC126907950 [Daktulosphaira vitifoliae]|uniref:uncharacterized protein LOC126907950 n=1 Tax=Daktulosphaira vitifoliae TaxID=58002 RepID=UPI0021A9B5EC|nr:uncharacterized protein LOC126907950 [Daktulosphaira vitifoliae]